MVAGGGVSGGRAELSRSPGALKKKDLSATTHTRRASYGRDPHYTSALLPPPLLENFPDFFCTNFFDSSRHLHSLLQGSETSRAACMAT